MPELPEVETIRRGLERNILNVEIKDLTVRKPKMVRGDVDEFKKILNIGHSLINDCDCPTDKNQKDEKEWGGCPKCTFSTNFCQTKNKELSKKGAKEFFFAFQLL